MALVKKPFKTEPPLEDAQEAALLQSVGHQEDIYAEVSNAIRTVIQALDQGVMTVQQVQNLAGHIKEKYPMTEEMLGMAGSVEIEDPGYGPGFDLLGEFNTQIRTIRAMQARIQNPNGTIKTDISPREAKELITAGGTMLTSLLKHHKEVLSMDRQRAIEAAVIETIKILPDEIQEKYWGTLEKALPKES